MKKNINKTGHLVLRRSCLPLILFLGSFLSQSAFAIGTEEATTSPMQALAQAQSANTLSTTTTTETSTASSGGALDCSYALPDASSGTPINISPDTIIQWANYATTQTFTYDFRNYDKQFKELKACYTTAGWDSFLSAIKASNNLKVTQEEHLFVSAKVNGQSQLVSQSTEGTQSTWTVRVPILVTYQNQDREVSQDMNIDLTIKPTYGLPSHLGINQIIASPKETSSNSHSIAGKA